MSRLSFLIILITLAIYFGMGPMMRKVFHLDNQVEQGKK